MKKTIITIGLVRLVGVNCSARIFNFQNEKGEQKGLKDLQHIKIIDGSNFDSIQSITKDTKFKPQQEGYYYTVDKRGNKTKLSLVSEEDEVVSKLPEGDIKLYIEKDLETEVTKQNLIEKELNSIEQSIKNIRFLMYK